MEWFRVFKHVAWVRHSIIKLCLYGLIIGAAFFSFGYNGVLHNFENSTTLFRSTDFEYFYVGGKLWNEGLNSYDVTLFRDEVFKVITGPKAEKNDVHYLYVYPPQASLFFSRLAIFPVETAQFIFLIINCLLLLASLAMLALILSWYRPVHLEEIVLLISLLGTGFARHNVREGQQGLIISTLLLGTFVLAHYGRPLLAGLCLGLISYKPSTLPLFLGYYLFRRSWRLFISAVVTIALLTVLPLLLTQRPVVSSLLDWSHAILMVGADNADNPSPDLPNSATLVYLLPLVYRVFNSESGLTTLLNWLIILALVGYSTYLLWRSRTLDRSQTELLDFSIVSVLSLLATYHRVYDIFLIVPAIIYFYLHAMKSSDKTTQRNWLLFIGGVILLLFMPVDLFQQVAMKFPSLQDFYPLRVIAPFQTWVALAVLAALLRLKSHQVALQKAAGLTATAQLTEPATLTLIPAPNPDQTLATPPGPVPEVTTEQTPTQSR